MQFITAILSTISITIRGTNLLSAPPPLGMSSSLSFSPFVSSPPPPSNFPLLFLLEFTEAALKKEVASNKAKSRFVATVSHGTQCVPLLVLLTFNRSFSPIEMRTPLTTILGWLEVLETSQLSSDLLSKLSVLFPH